MKKLILFFVALLGATGLFAMTSVIAGVESSAAISIDLGTFTGIVTLISAVVTQVLKVIPSISSSRIAKIGVSILIGMVLCLIAWTFKISVPLTALLWWQVLVYGIAAGLSGCGFYDVVKTMFALFRSEKIEK